MIMKSKNLQKNKMYNINDKITKEREDKKRKKR